MLSAGNYDSIITVLSSGLLCGAEAVSPNHAIRKTLVVLRKPWKNFELARGMNPLKLFFDLHLGSNNLPTIHLLIFDLSIE